MLFKAYEVAKSDIFLEFLFRSNGLLFFSAFLFGLALFLLGVKCLLVILCAYLVIMGYHFVSENINRESCFSIGKLAFMLSVVSVKR